ncbi:MAG TPA: hypothetical protein VF786_01205, partial [Terriglobales bacterium]
PKVTCECSKTGRRESLFARLTKAYALRMPRIDASREGLRIIKSEPLLFALELLWRWSFAMGAIGIMFLALRPLVAAVQLTQMDQEMLASHNPDMIAGVLGEIMVDVLPVIGTVLAWSLPALALLWAAAVTLGRGFTARIIVRNLSDASGRQLPSWTIARWRAMAGISLGRVAMGLILFIGYVGGIIIARWASGVAFSRLSPLVSAATFMLVFGVAVGVWMVVNWFLSLAPLFVVRDGSDTLTSVAQALRFTQVRGPELRNVAMWNGLIRAFCAALFVIAGTLCVPLGRSAPVWLVGGLGTAIAVGYCVVSDYFLLARFAAYGVIAMDAQPMQASLEDQLPHSNQLRPSTPTP